MLAAIETDRRGRPARLRPGGHRRAAVPPGLPAELIIPAVVVGKGPDGHRWVTTIDDAEPDLRRCRTPPVPPVNEFPVRPADPGRRLSRRRRRGPRRRAPAGAHQGRHRPRRRRRGRATRSTSTPSCCACGPRSDRATATRVDGFVGASPELLVPATATSAVPTRWPARRRAPATRRPTPGWPPSCIASMKNQVEHRVVIDVVHDTLLPYCSYLDWEPEPSIVAVANVQHLGTLIEGRFSRPAPERARARPAAVARPRRSAGTPGTRRSP